MEFLLMVVLGGLGSVWVRSPVRSSSNLVTGLPQVCGALSGGEQQMVAIGRGLMADPIVILLDDPSVGLAVLLVEQNVRASFKIADRAVVMQRGRVVVEGT